MSPGTMIFERHVVRVERVIDPAAALRSEMCESPISLAMLQRSSDRAAIGRRHGKDQLVED